MFVYSLTFGWKYAVGFVVLIFFHEMGHYPAARNRGLDVRAPMFVPFVGAWIQLKDMLILLAVLAPLQLKAALQKDNGASGLPEGYYDVDVNVRINYSVFYLGLSGFLAIMSDELHKTLPHI